LDITAFPDRLLVFLLFFFFLLFFLAFRVNRSKAA